MKQAQDAWRHLTLQAQGNKSGGSNLRVRRAGFLPLAEQQISALYYTRILSSGTCSYL